MFDFGKITETLTSLGASSGNGEAAGLTGPAAQILEAAGLDPGMLEGLNQTEILGLLSEHGIDVAQLTEGQIGELIQSAGVPSSLLDIASSWLGNNRT